MNNPEKKRLNKKEAKPTLESILSNHDEKTIYFDIIVRDYEVFAEFGNSNKSQTAKWFENYSASITKIVIYGNIYRDYIPLGYVEIYVLNQGFWEMSGYTKAGRQFLGVARTINWDEDADNLNLWLNLLQVGTAQRREITMNIEFESFSIEDPEPKIPHNINSWACKTVRFQSGSNKIATRIKERASK